MMHDVCFRCSKIMDQVETKGGDAYVLRCPQCGRKKEIKMVKHPTSKGEK